jgi:hypothetical protein
VTSNEAFEQIDAVNLSTVANIATALTVLTAVVFGLIEMRRARKEREERAAFVAVQAILTPAWMQSMSLVQAISDGTTPSQIEADPRLFQAVQSIAGILESSGYAVFACMVPLNVVDELLGGTVRVARRNYVGMSNTNVSAQVRKKIGNGFSGSPNRSTGIAKPEPVSPSVRTRLTVTGALDLDLAAVSESRCEFNEAFPNLCRCPSRESENERWL